VTAFQHSCFSVSTITVELRLLYTCVCVSDHINWAKSVFSLLMDRETTQRLLRESIIFLCKTYLGADAAAGFEIDSIICVSRCHGTVGSNAGTSFDDPRPVVFKFHELVTDDSPTTGDNVQSYGSTMGDWQYTGPSLEFGTVPAALSFSRKRKIDESQSGDKYTESAKKMNSSVKAGQITMNGDFEKIKKEADWSADSESVESNKNDCTTKHKLENQAIDRGSSKSRENSSVSSQMSNANNTLSISSASSNCVKGQLYQTGANMSQDLSVAGSLHENKPAGNTRAMSSKAATARNAKSAADDLALESDLAPSASRATSTSCDASDSSDVDPSSTIEQSVPRNCDVCHQVFADFPAFNVHCTSAHGRFACPFCELSFSCESARERHLFEHTGEPVDEDSVGDERTSPSSADVSTEAAGRSFGNVGSEGQNAKSASAIDLSSDNEDESLGANGSYFESHLLSRRGTISTHALRAIASLDPSRPFVCDVCRAQFEESSELCDHCATVHRRVPCPYCGRSFSQKASMERHQRQHTGERPYRCTMCHSSYTRKENLQTHFSRMHSMSSSAAVQSHHPVADFVNLE
jgi:Zinc finger, C2H2 type